MLLNVVLTTSATAVITATVALLQLPLVNNIKATKTATTAINTQCCILTTTTSI